MKSISKIAPRGNSLIYIALFATFLIISNVNVGAYPTLGTTTSASARITGQAGFSNFGAPNSSGPVTYAPVAYSCNGGLVEVPVQVTSFTGVGAISLTLNYDKAVITFNSLVNTQGMINDYYVDESGATGIIRLSGITLTEFNLDDFDTLVTLIFDFHGGSATLAWDDSDDTWCEYASAAPDYIPFTDDPTEDFYINGSVTDGTVVADFSASDLLPPKNTTVQLTDLSTGSPTGWIWSFDRPSVTFVGPTNQFSQNPQVQFTDGGLYTVTLTITNAGCEDVEVKTAYIRAGNPGLWDGPTSTDWYTDTNWDNYVVPSTPIDVTIPTRPLLDHFYPHVTGNLTVGSHCNSITLTGTAELTVDGVFTVNTGKILDIQDDAKVNAAGF